MQTNRRLWLITNEASGSASPAALADLDLHFSEAELQIVQHSAFPARELPTPQVLDAAKIDLVAIFGGDGTVNSVLSSLAGWSGAALVLPGGTMNLVHRRLFGEATLEETLQAVASGEAVAMRPAIISSPLGFAFAGMLAGPGTAWNNVREALRGAAIADLPGDITEAIAHSLSGPMIHCVEPPLGRAEGYPLLLAAAEQGAITLNAYYAETAGDYLAQGLALARRDFREGPHDLLGTTTRIRLAADIGGATARARGGEIAAGNRSGDGDGGFGVLLDGEPAWADGPMEFTLAQSPVDLLATHRDG